MSAQDDFNLFKQVAELLELEDDESSNFITSAMRRRGHKPRTEWEDSDSSGSNNQGDFFSPKSKQRRQVRPSGRQGGSPGWQYDAS